MNGVARALAGWTGERGPRYRRLAGSLEAAIREGRLAPGSRLPPERELAAELAVSRSTLIAAYEELKERGLLTSMQGSGTFVARDAVPLPASPIERSSRRAGEGVIDLSLATPSVSPVVERTVRDLPPGALLLGADGYQAAGLPALRRAVAALLASQGVPTDPEQVLITTGAQQAISLVAAHLLRPGDPAAVESPTYAGTLDALRATGARLLPVPVGSDGVSPEAVREVILRGSPRLLHLTPTYHNPTGATLSATARVRLARIVEQLRVPLVEDLAMTGIGMGPPAPPPIAASSPEAPILTVGSMSKLFLPGLRVGWLRGPTATVARLARLKAVADLGTSALSQTLAVLLLECLEEAESLRRHELTPRRDHLAACLREHLPEWRWQLPSGGLSLWVQLPSEGAVQFADVALRHGVAVAPGPVFAADEGAQDRLRLVFTLPPDQLEEAVRRLAAAWAAFVAGARPAPAPPAVV